MRHRLESDYLGKVRVPAGAYWGAQTQRAIENFPISGMKASTYYIVATAQVKLAAAEANLAAGLLPEKKAKAIMKAAMEVADGKFNDQFQVDIFQAGAGTSHNMNANEVIANRAIEILGGRRGDYSIVHPNDDVNMGQSTNDVIPTVIRLASLRLVEELKDEMIHLAGSFHRKALDFDDIIKGGRTHLMDAAPIRLGQEFEAWAVTIRRDIQRLDAVLPRLREVNIGATAVGTGLNADPVYVEEVVKILSRITGFNLKHAENLPQATQSATDFSELSSALRSLAIDLVKISNDLRLMNSGPVTGFAEIRLPPVQPGSSIMPGKVNPSVPEMVDMVGFQVISNDIAVMLCAQAGQLELNVMLPLIAHSLIQSLLILKNSCRVFADRCVKGIKANKERMEKLLHSSPGVSLAIAPYLGFAKAAEVTKKAIAEGVSIKKIVEREKLLPQAEIERIFDVHSLTEMGIAGKNLKHKGRSRNLRSKLS
jgi:aspartate ammonia-lyase